MDIKSLYTFIAAVDCGSFAEGAKSMGVSISSVSLQMQALEKDLGIGLFDRSTRPPTVTEEGWDFAARARDLVRQWESLAGGLSKNTGTILRIGAVHTTLTGLVPPAIYRLRNSQPAFTIRLASGLTHDLEHLVLRRTLDCAVITHHEQLDSRLDAVKISKDPMMLIKHKSVRGRDVKQILHSQPYVRFNHMAWVAKLIDAELTSMNIKVRSNMEISTLDAVVSLVRNRLGVSIVPRVAGGKAFSDELRAIPFGNPPVFRELCVIYRHDTAKSHLIELLTTQLRNQLVK